jgi:hypothetical protein
MVPLTVDGLIYASSMVMLDSARRKTPVPALARWLLGLGIAAALAAPLGEQAAEIFADQLAAHRVPSVRAIRAQLHVGQPRRSGCETTPPRELQGGWKVALREQLAGDRDKPTAEAQRATAARK